METYTGTRPCQGGGAATRLTADQLHSGSSPDLGLGNSGHSIRETPGLIPNPEVKPDNVPYGTEVRESSGTYPRCYCSIILTQISYCFLISKSGQTGH